MNIRELSQITSPPEKPRRHSEKFDPVPLIIELFQTPPTEAVRAGSRRFARLFQQTDRREATGVEIVYHAGHVLKS